MWYRILLNRLILAAVTLLGVAVVVFVLVRVVPGDPIAMMIAPGASEADIQDLRVRYGLDLPIVQQFTVWIKGILAGDFGKSFSLRQGVVGLVVGRVPATLELAGLALAIAMGLGVGIAVVATLARGRWLETLIDNVNGLVLAVPDFIWALVFVLVLGVLWPVLPISGRVDPRLDLDLASNFYLAEAFFTGQFKLVGHLLTHMIMPAVALALPLAAIIARVMKGALQEAMLQDYVVLARIKGFSRLRIVLQEAMRNAVVPVLSLTGVQFTFLVGGTVIVERIFSYPGIGNMAIDAVINRDLPLIQGLVLAFAIMFILINLAVDLITIVLNPRLRHG
ncbi:MAG: ABC transporter permease [Alphaproteobacteria bacterium]|nr:ABC transporter permease [Alphaproteobacteria bacterium]